MSERLMSHEEAFNEAITMQLLLRHNDIASYDSVSQYLDKTKASNPKKYDVLVNYWVEQQKLEVMTSRRNAALLKHAFDTEAENLFLSYQKAAELKAVRAPGTPIFAITADSIYAQTIKSMKKNPGYSDLSPEVFDQLAMCRIAQDNFLFLLP